MKPAELEAIRAYIDAAAELAAINALKARPIITSLEVAGDTDDIVEKVLARIPTPEPGTPGKDAEPVDRAAIVQEVLALIPPPKDGEPGKDAPPVDMLALAQSVLALIPTPRDGRDGIASRDELMMLVNAKVAETLGPVVEAAVTAALAERPDVRYRDVWKAETDYRIGNLVTFGGSMWHCNVSGTTAKPEDGSDDWTLAVKKGRDFYAPPAKVK